MKGEGHPQPVVTGFRGIVVGPPPAVGEHLHAGQSHSGVVQVLAVAAGNVGDRAQHERGGHRQLGEGARQAEKAAGGTGCHAQDPVQV